jgi:uncharacterized membrane protein YphA (DoxX/SURF4 family)
MPSGTLTRPTATATVRPASNGAASVTDRLTNDPGYQAFWLLRIGFAVLPIALGLDKFFDVLVNWEIYLAPWINDIVPGTGAEAMYAVGVIEILAGIAVALKPRYAAYVVAAWLGGIIVSLLTVSGYYDVALRDFGLLLGALTLARLASKYDPPLFGSRA